MGLFVRIVKIIKFYAWELAIEDKVKQLRNQARAETKSRSDGAGDGIDLIGFGLEHVRSWRCSCATSSGTWPRAPAERCGGKVAPGVFESASAARSEALFLSFSLSPVLVALGAMANSGAMVKTLRRSRE